MSIFHSLGPSLPQIPDNLTLPQFLLDKHPLDFLDRTRKDIDAFNLQLRDDLGLDCGSLIEEDTGRQLRFSEMKERSDALARALKAKFGSLLLGPDQSQRSFTVSIFSPNHLYYTTCIWATHRLGGIVSPMSSTSTVSELGYQLKLIKSSLMFVHEDCLSVALEAISNAGLTGIPIIVIESSRNDLYTVDQLVDLGNLLPPYPELHLSPGEAKEKIAFLSFSSGTTGMPKAVMLSHYNIICNIIQMAAFHRVFDSSIERDEQRFRPGDVGSCAVPIYHIYGLTLNLHFPLFARMNVVISRKFDFEVWLKSIEEYRISHIWIVPPQAILFCKHPAVKSAKLSSLRYCMIAGAPASAELCRQFQEVFPGIEFGQGFGMTETSPVATLFPLSERVGKIGSVGQLVSGTLAKIVRPDGKLATYGEAGELLLKGGQIALGYYGNKEATRETFVDGWLKTGDVAIIHPDGSLNIVDRLKEFLKVKGFQVAPPELEGHLLSHPYIADAAVIGIPDEYAGQLPRAYIVLHPDKASAVREDADMEKKIRSLVFNYVSEAKARYKWLDGGICFVNAIPKSPTGKILRRVLREVAKKEIMGGEVAKSRL
ncbi:hypothetical protein GYMLUDRAFT_42071 [Collybiopsis luxurians FD-317 M1]|uniref:Phenylacetyl-CoA ligase n=1 Tax=Collybiopsis luxurians FD-317 M1 TaxID=944289 RepID=A0A0D0C3E0_9AGAR|nr:hypothetical protein GYMLUDRAFT_42071 [Collybiopsis luxurians FD-317 M1]